MVEHLNVEFVVDHEYRVRLDDGGDSVESTFVIHPDVLADLGIDSGTEQRVVEHTARFLAERQSVLDFPTLVYLDEIAAAYDNFADDLRRRLG
ncbi:hypothetical protein [Prescottella subtropica]|uniref:hypothetical protein n=1 Tax=Prescottella subtropica TaxID=2545757 RepID=UPI0010F5C907|nr:hypothetical protein [Prescottella subtropica]